MPCSMSREEIEYYEQEDNKKKFGKDLTDDKLLEEVACQMGRLIVENDLMDKASYLIKAWVKEHMTKDKKAGRGWARGKKD